MPDPTMHCRLCPEVTPIEGIVEHVRLMHPDVWEGTPVVVDAGVCGDTRTSAAGNQLVCERAAGHVGWHRADRASGAMFSDYVTWTTERLHVAGYREVAHE